MVGPCRMRESPCTTMAKFSTFSESFWYIFSASGHWTDPDPSIAGRVLQSGRREEPE